MRFNGSQTQNENEFGNWNLLIYQIFKMRNLEILKITRDLKAVKSLVQENQIDFIESNFDDIFNDKKYINISPEIAYNIKMLSNLYNNYNYKLFIEKIAELIEALQTLNFKFRCDQKWKNLIKVKEDVGFCNLCTRHVYQVDNEVDLKKRISVGQCVFLTKDLYTPFSKQSCSLADHEMEDLGLMPDSIFDHVQFLPFQLKIDNNEK